jgi:hypothetical protein
MEALEGWEAMSRLERAFLLGKNWKNKVIERVFVFHILVIKKLSTYFSTPVDN